MIQLLLALATIALMITFVIVFLRSSDCLLQHSYPTRILEPTLHCWVRTT